MSSFWDTVRNGVWNLRYRSGIIDILDILVVAFLIYKLILMMRQTRSIGALKGLLLFLAAAGVSRLLGLTALSWILMAVLSNGVIVLLILFQPEIRSALEHMGRAGVVSLHNGGTADEERIVNEITQTVLDLSARKVGALIVFEQKTGLQDIIDTGTRLDARISAPLLENIFEPKTPLHDGAVVIRGNTIMAAACILKLTENTAISRELGTRHRAAIGVTETTDARALIVSEETGIISRTAGGVITRRMNERDVRSFLREMYRPAEAPLTKRVQKLFQHKGVKG